MIWLSYYSKLNLADEDEIFKYLLQTMKPSNLLWSYFVNWSKVLVNAHALEVNLNILNYLIGKDDFDNEFRTLVKQYPTIVHTLPALAVRDGKNVKKFKIIKSFEDNKIIYDDFDFSKTEHTNEDIEKYLEFVTKTGIKKILTDKTVKNLVDYMLGVEAGLDSNGRKNRSGHSMESIVESFVKSYCEANGAEYLKEANAVKIKLHYGIDVPVDKSSRRYDFVVRRDGKLYLIETNFYAGGGTKLKSTAGEYRNLQDKLDKKFGFIWVTDGLGWNSSHLPLRDTFNNNDYTVNLSMLENGILEEIIGTKSR